MKTYRSGEFCKRVGISKKTLFKYIKEGILKPKVLPSGQYRFTEEDVQKFLSIRNGSNVEKRVGIYCRVSTAEQKPHLENQINICKVYVYENNIGKIEKIYNNVDNYINTKIENELTKKILFLNIN